MTADDQFAVTVSYQPDWCVVTVKGEVDAFTAASLPGTLAQAAMSRRSPVLAVDLSGVGFIDAAGIAALVGAAKKIGEHGTLMMLIDPSATVLRTFHLAGMAHSPLLRRTVVAR